MKNLNYLLFAIAALALTACQPDDPALTTLPPKYSPPTISDHYEQQFEFTRAGKTDKQEEFAANTVSVLFKASFDNSKLELQPKDLTVKENGVNVTKFSMAKMKDAQHNQTAEIVFVIDITQSMVKLIETMKLRLESFIKSSRTKGYHTRMCFVTFGDYTTKQCTSFFDNDPSKPDTIDQQIKLISELHSLHGYVGEGEDPGWPDLDENPLRALIDASHAPWSPDALHFAVLVTDWGFLYLPENPGTAEQDFKLHHPGQPVPDFAGRNKVPHYNEAIDAIRAAKMQVFAVTREQAVSQNKLFKFDGYSTPFQGQPSLVDATDPAGAHFDFDQVKSGKISLDSIFDKILFRLDSTYQLTYVADNNPGLNPALPNSKRSVEVTSPRAPSLKVINISSSMPNGHAEPLRSFKPSDNGAVDPDSLQVKVNGKVLDRSEYSFQGDSVILNSTPPPGASLNFSYFYADPGKNFTIVPFSIQGVATARNTTVTLNGITADPSDLLFIPDTNGNTSFSLKPSAVNASDRYNIRRNQGVDIKIEVRHQ